ncbi:GEVED domain-containing protein [Hymenobacter negativus]|uniref:PKD domain-containing protein n=1 Tax=Hymenobacter negativus TaxID=2795026 RepID=A0ABS3QCV8_9BACT|nr:GEVED domain-containing protein [Hymenobacter negativus]MBO2009022.1 PKD domain-containing protein [Hymenobacter negativus]
MNPLLRTWSRIAPGMVAALLALGAATPAVAQCPINAVCTPGTASSAQAGVFGMAILNVTVGTTVLANRTSYTAGYHDYSCSVSAVPLVVGQSYPISIRTTAAATQNVRVWIDYNNDGAFTGNTELVYEDLNLTGTPANPHTGNFVPPAAAVLGTRLRMRVATDYINSALPTSCSTPEYSQDEDYSVTLSANVSPPTAAFTTDATTTCSGCVQFTDVSQNLPTSWLWTFGDGQTSTQQNPNHCYTTAGTYAVTLRATNAAGNNTSAATSIVYNTTVPVAASCSPQTSSYFANYGIIRFQLNTIDNTSANGSAGYQNFTCTQRTELTAGVNYPMVITTGGVNPHDIRVYLDKNNDGILTTAEQVYVSLNTATPGATATFTLPTGTTLNQPLRLRIIADAIGNTAGPCVGPASGQAEDYTIVARPNTLPPIISFSTNYVAGACVNPIQFTDLTSNLPTSWLWNFGDGQTSTQQNPLHTYTNAGTYNVSLSATNSNGTASITRLNAVTIQIPCFNYCASNGTGTNGPTGPQTSALWTTGVSVSNASPAYTNGTGIATGGYANYTANPITMPAGSAINLTVTTNLFVAHRTSVWVDYNLNGVFDTNELLATGVSTGGATANTYTATFTVPSSSSASGLSTRMRIQTAANTSAANACGINIVNAEVEDYQLRFSPLASRNAAALPALGLYPNPTLDGHLRLSLPDASAAGIYATEVQNVLGAAVLRTSLRLGPATEAELDLSALPAGVYVLHLRDAKGQTATRRVVRE